MTSRLMNAYAVLPTKLQELALSAYGVRNRARLRAWHEVIRAAHESETWSADRQVAYVDARLRHVMTRAVDEVPRYAQLRWLRGYLHDGRNSALAMLEEFPVISREEILANRERFLSLAFKPRELVSTVTSGTTGTPFRTFLEPWVLMSTDALWWRRTEWAGYKEGDWIARLVGDPVVPLSQSSPTRPFRVSPTDRRLYLSTYHLSAASAPAMARALNRFRPAFIMGYPSALEALAHLSADVRPVWRPKAILYSSEPLFEHQRRVVSGHWKAPLRGLYGCTERAISASECAAGSYHLSLLDGYVEGQFGADDALLSSASRPITSLLNAAMPLIRYELGDLIEPQPDRACACGRTLPVMSAVVTKHEDAVRTASGRVVSPSILTWAFKDLEGVRQSQVLQHADWSIEILVVADPTCPSDSLDVLRRRVEEMTFHELAVTVTPVSTLIMTKAGKTRFVVSEVSQTTVTP